jgi:hypothetical protein
MNDPNLSRFTKGEPIGGLRPSEHYQLGQLSLSPVFGEAGKSQSWHEQDSRLKARAVSESVCSGAAVTGKALAHQLPCTRIVKPL